MIDLSTGVLQATDAFPSEFPIAAFQKNLITWFSKEKRDLPWRNNVPPYQVWISEIMLQQTRVDQVIPYYERFLDHFPTVALLAQANLDDVLRIWEGLGYYSRARNLHRGAADVMNLHNGEIPDSYAQLLTISGIGPYTAAAISSIVFGEAQAVVDGNVIRVLTRLFGFADVVSTSASKKWLSVAANTLLDPNAPGPFNEAMMELGALVCTPRKPKCGTCPVAKYCRAQKTETQLQFPVKKPKKKTPHLNIAVGVIQDDRGHILIQKRPVTAMLGGLWEFPGGKQEREEPIEVTCWREIVEETGLQVNVGAKIASIDHAYSHFKITLHAFYCDPGEPIEIESSLETKWVAREELVDYAFPRANRRLLEIMSGDSDGTRMD
jgi:A/G-specific adenine glycosylase